MDEMEVWNVREVPCEMGYLHVAKTVGDTWTGWAGQNQKPGAQGLYSSYDDLRRYDTRHVGGLGCFTDGKRPAYILLFTGL